MVVLILDGTKKTQMADMKKAGAALRWLQGKAAEEKAAKAPQKSAKMLAKPNRKGSKL